jgi:hypothetical protein
VTRRITALGGVALVPAALLIAGLGSDQAEKRDAFWAGINPVEVASGPAHRGPWRMNASDFDYIDDPTVAMTEDGHVGVAWADQARQNVFFQMYTPDGQARFPEPVNVSSTPGIFSWLPRLVIAAGDQPRVYALWQEITRFSTFYVA